MNKETKRSIFSKEAGMILLALMFVALMLFGHANAFAAASGKKGNDPVLTKSLTINVGACETLQVQKVKKQNVKWRVVSGKNNIYLKANKKKAEISGLKPGKAKVLAKVGKKSLCCNIKVCKVNTYVGNKDGDGDAGNTAEVLQMSGNSISQTAGLKKQNVALKQPSQKFSYSTADFSVKMLRQLMKQDKTGKVLISPDSILTALAMTENGAEGQTLKEMQDVMGKGIGLKDYNSYLSRLNKSLEASKGVKYKVANSLWQKQDGLSEWNPAFLQMNKDYYNAEVYDAPFDASTVSDLNAWCNNHTDGMIKKIVDDLNEDTRFLLVNSVLFEGKWLDQYEDYQVRQEKFTSENGTKKTVSMMNEETRSYITLNGGTGFIKPYNNTRFAFVGIVPKKGQSLDSFVNGITGQDFVIACKSKKTMKTLTKLPEFSYDYEKSLKEPLKAMGIKRAFSPELAQFKDKMATLKDPSSNMFISEVLHKTHIELDRNGTRAAAVTAVMVDATSCAPVEEKTKRVYLNRPFLYAIIDTQTGIPLFMGTVKTI